MSELWTSGLSAISCDKSESEFLDPVFSLERLLLEELTINTPINMVMKPQSAVRIWIYEREWIENKHTTVARLMPSKRIIDARMVVVVKMT